MSCRWTLNLRGAPDAWLDTPETVSLYFELARAGRKDEFCWFARSQGVPDDRVEVLWLGLLARLAASPTRSPD
jgi:hypothetical protein